MGIGSSKLQQNEKEIPLNESVPNQTLASIDSGLSAGTASTLSPFQRLRNLSFVNRYEKFSAAEQNHSLNNLEGELTPKRSPSTLKQRLIKALGGYNLLDPRSPNQLFARTPLAFGKKEQKTGNNSISGKNLILETSMNETTHVEDENPYAIFEEQLDEEQNGLELEDKHSTPNKSNISAVSSKQSTPPTVDEFDGLVLNSKDPRSISEGIQRTPMTFAIGVLETPKLEIHQVQQVEKMEENQLPNKAASTAQSLLKSMYKEIVKRDPIYNDLLHEDDIEDGKTTPVKKPFSEIPKERTPLSCLVNKQQPLSNTKRGLNPKKIALDDITEDIFSPKVFELIHDGEENTPTNPPNMSKLNTFSSITKSNQSKIPVSRTRRLH